VTELPQQGMRAVHTGSSFDSWAMVDANSRCCCCASNNYPCCHAQFVTPASSAAVSGPVAAEWSSWDAKVQKDVDYDSGQRRSTCVSRCRLPEDLRDNPALMSIATGEQYLPSNPLHGGVI
jgi:hypothetical protein